MAAEPKEMRVFLTLQDVLNTGIVEATATVVGDDAATSKARIETPNGDGGTAKFLLIEGGEGRVWHRHRSSANRYAQAIRRAYVENMQAQIDVVNALDFGASTGGFRG